jgi:hypothetical protein
MCLKHVILKFFLKKHVIRICIFNVTRKNISLIEFPPTQFIRKFCPNFLKETNLVEK